jgi:hypothetical protein
LLVQHLACKRLAREQTPRQWNELLTDKDAEQTHERDSRRRRRAYVQQSVDHAEKDTGA